MTDLTVRVTGLDPITRWGTSAQPIVRKHGVILVNRLTLSGVRAAKGRVGVRTGHLRRSLTHEPARAVGGVIVGAFGTNVPYARVHNDGRGPVVARAGGMLRFTIGGAVLYRKRVGPAQGRKYMEAGAAEIRKRAPAELALCARNIVAELRAA